MSREVPINLTDLEDMRFVLKSLSNYFAAKELMEAQITMSRPQISEMRSEIDRLQSRFDGYLSDFLYREHERESNELEDEDIEEDLETLEEPENGNESLTEASEGEILSGFPLGTVERAKGRKLSKEELQARAAELEADDGPAE